MIIKTEVIFNDDLLETTDGLMPLSVGDIFYFSIRGTSPASEYKYISDYSEYKESFLKEVINNINGKANEYHIKQFIVTKLSNGYQKDYTTSVSNPRIVFTRSLTVEEYVKEKEDRDNKIKEIVS